MFLIMPLMHQENPTYTFECIEKAQDMVEEAEGNSLDQSVVDRMK